MLTKTNSRKFVAPRRQANENPKSEYRNPKQTRRQINLKLGKSKTPNPNQECFEFCVFQSFEFVSNFGFRASKFFLGALCVFARVTGVAKLVHNFNYV
jgi:hypothetical protein